MLGVTCTAVCSAAGLWLLAKSGRGGSAKEAKAVLSAVLKTSQGRYHHDLCNGRMIQLQVPVQQFHFHVGLIGIPHLGFTDRLAISQ